MLTNTGSVLKVESDIIIMLPVRAEKHPRAGKGTQAQGEGAGRGGRLAGSAKKSPGHLGGKRGRLIVPEDRQIAIDLIEEAIAAGARRCTACAVLAIDVRTWQRWKKALQEEHKLQDQRKAAAAERVPANKLSDEEREAILTVCKRPEYQSLPPSQIVPRLADKGDYLASESSFYRLLREADQLHRRGKAKAPRTVAKPEDFQATGPNQVWSWDITFLASIIRGAFYRLYLVLYIFSRKIVGWEVHENESADHASVLIHKACLAAGIHQDGLVLHADNGGPMKGATILATLQKLGVVPSFSRPSVSDDNPYSESLFRTLKYAPAYPSKPFETIEAALGSGFIALCSGTTTSTATAPFAT